MSTIDQSDDGAPVVHTKGAPEVLLARCSHVLDSDGRALLLDEPQRQRVETAVNAFAAEGLRVLGFAQRQLSPEKQPPHDRVNAEQDLCFAGLIAMLDPPRPGVVEAVAQCRAAGAGS